MEDNVNINKLENKKKYEVFLKGKGTHLESLNVKNPLSSTPEISELKSSLRSMDKFKYVLNHKIHLLQEEIQPKVN
jgi:hypothetical protein